MVRAEPEAASDDNRPDVVHPDCASQANTLRAAMLALVLTEQLFSLSDASEQSAQSADKASAGEHLQQGRAAAR